MFVKKSILQIIVAGVVTIVNAANADPDAAHTRGLRAESLESRDVPAVNVSAYVSIDEVEAIKESLSPTNDRGDNSMQAKSLESLASTTSIIKDEISSRIKAAFLDDVVSFTQSSSSPTHDSMDGCVKAKDDLELRVYISNAQNFGDGQVRLCPGTIHFYDEIVLDDSITLSCAGTKGSCILDGNEATRHFVSGTASLTLSFIDLAFINGFADDSSNDPGFGGSLDLFGSSNTFSNCLFYNNLVTSSTDDAVSII